MGVPVRFFMYQGVSLIQRSVDMIKNILVLGVLLFFFPFMMEAQEKVEEVAQQDLVTDGDGVVADSLSAPLPLPLNTPLFGIPAPGFDGCLPWYMGTYGTMWNLHEGFNAQLGMSLMAGLGKHAPSGVGFGQTANLAYAMPLGKGFSVAAGLYLQNMDWGAYSQRDVGLSAVLGYQINDIVSVYAYGTKSFMPNREPSVMASPFYPDNFRDRIGAMAEFKIGENAKISVSVERSSFNASPFPFCDQPTGTKPMERDAMNRTRK